MSRRRRRSSRRTPRRESRSLALIGAILLIVSPFVPNIAFGSYTSPGQTFPQLTGGIGWWFLSLWGIIALIMGMLALIGLLIDSGDVTMILCVLGGIIGLLIGILNLIWFITGGIILAFAPATALLGGLLTLLGALRIRV
ncbi:MAG: hypothetical protein WED07_04975 [Candidatus Freyarchaeum deiterrae]